MATVSIPEDHEGEKRLFGRREPVVIETTQHASQSISS